MNFNEFYRVLDKNRYYVFSFEDILSLFPGETGDNLKKTVYRWNNNGRIYTLKRGLYELTYPKDHNIPDLFIANKMYQPSYVSLETALSHYSIIPEVSMAVTSITAKPTRKFKNKHGLFLYRTVKPEFFTGYYIEKQFSYDILIAEPEKAIIDYLYLNKYPGKMDLADKRFNRDILANLRKNKLSKYARLFNLDLKEFYAYL